MLYGCETWSLTLRDERRLRAFDKRIRRRIFGPKRYEIGEERRLHNEVLHCLHRSSNIVRVGITIEKNKQPKWKKIGRRAFNILTTQERDFQESLGLAVRAILECLKEIGINMRIDSAQDSDYWRTLVITALDHQSP